VDYIDIDMGDYQYYPLIDDPNFEKLIYKKQEFHESIIPEETRTITEICNPSEFRPFPQQNFIKNFINPNTPYNGLLIYHGTGVGKTCTAITVAENFRKESERHFKCIVITPLKDVFVNGIYDMRIINNDISDKAQCTKDTYSLTDYEKEYIFRTKLERKNEILKRIAKHYNIVTPLAFVNDIKRKLYWQSGNKKDLTRIMKKNIRKLFSNKLIIIDEVHTLKTHSNIEKTIPPVLETIIKYAKNTKLILMSATPIFNDVREIIFIINLLLLNDNRQLLKTSDIFDSKNNFVENGQTRLHNILRGYVSYLRSDNPITFPLKIISDMAIIPKFKYDAFSFEPIPSDLQLKTTKLICCPMSKEQYTSYLKIIYNKKDKKMTGKSSKSKEVSHTEIPAISNIILYDKNNLPVFGTRMYSMNGPIVTNQNNYLFYHYNYNPAYVKTSLFAEKNIEKYSSKFYKLLQNVKNSKGIILIYTQYIKAGCIPISLMLEQNGISRYTHSNKIPNLLTAENITYPICYLCAEQIGHKNHHKGSKMYHEFSKMTYLLVSGDKLLSSISTNTMLNLVNNDSNEDGKTIKIILGTDVLSQGLDFKRLRQIHIMEPWYNNSKLEQIIGRGIRNCSHLKTTELQRNVEIFQYASVPPKNWKNKQESAIETIDIHNYRLSENKDVKINTIKKILQEVAIDCALNINGNYSKKQLNIKYIASSGTTGVYKIHDKKPLCIYSPSTSDKIKLNNDTYNISTNFIYNSTIIQSIKNIFSQYSHCLLADIVSSISKISQSIIVENIYIILHQFIINKIPLVNKYNIDGYLIYRNKYYIFHPSMIKDENVSLYYKNIMPSYHKYSVSILDLITIQKNKKIIKNTQEPTTVKVDSDIYYNLIIMIVIEYIKLEAILATFIIDNKFNGGHQYMIDMIYDRLTIENHIYIIMFINQSALESEYASLIKLYLEQMNVSLSYANLMDYIKVSYSNHASRAVKEIITYTVYKNIITYNKKLGIVISNVITEVPRETAAAFDGKPNKLNIYGELSHTSHGLDFKIHDLTKYTGLKTKSDIISKSSIILGRTCSSFNKNDLISIVASLSIVINTVLNKKNVCRLLEFYFRYMHATKKKKNDIWFHKTIA
jgi:DNA polymerase III delta prime subunit